MSIKMEIIYIILGGYVMLQLPGALHDAQSITIADHFARIVRKSVFKD